MKKQNILVVLPMLPWPMLSGGHLAIYNGLAALCASGMNVYAVYYSGKSDYLSAERKCLEQRLTNITIEPYIDELSWRKNPYGAAHRLFIRLCKRFWARNEDFVFDRRWSLMRPQRGFVDFVLTKIAEWKIDIVQTEMMDMLPLVTCLPKNVKKVFVHHELAWVKNELLVQQVEPSINLLSFVTFSRILEIGLLNLYDAIITLSSIDKEKLLQAGVKTNIHSSFAIIETHRHDTLASNASCDGLTLSFIGPENHLPNKIGLNRFLDDCWECLKKTNSQYRLKIIGRWTDETIRVWSNRYQDIEFVGFVENLESALSGTVLIVPITIGSGIRMKILEAASYCVPFVSTNVGAEGLPFINNKACFLSDTIEGLVDGIRKMQDASLRQQFADNAYRVVSQNFSLAALIRNREQIYSDL